jgi:hypothetical protein
MNIESNFLLTTAQSDKAASEMLACLVDAGGCLPLPDKILPGKK